MQMNQLKRYFYSGIAYFGYLFFFIIKFKNYLLILKLKKRTIHVVCPGPSAGIFLEETIDNNDLVFFINHGIQLAENFKKSSNLFSFTIDGVRSYEILNYDFVKKGNIKTIFLPSHFFHYRRLSILKKIDIFLFPNIVFDSFYGFSLNSKSAIDFKSNYYRFSALGYGSLNSFLQFVVKLKPIEIKLYGCDFGEKNNIRYFNKTMPSSNSHPFGLMFEEFKIIKHNLERLDILVKVIV